MEVFEHADVPVHLVMTDILGLNNLGGCAAPPLFQTMFFLHDSSWLEGMKLHGLECEMPHMVAKNVARSVFSIPSHFFLLYWILLDLSSIVKLYT